MRVKNIKKKKKTHVKTVNTLSVTKQNKPQSISKPRITWSKLLTQQRKKLLSYGNWDKNIEDPIKYIKELIISNKENVKILFYLNLSGKLNDDKLILSKNPTADNLSKLEVRNKIFTKQC